MVACSLTREASLRALRTRVSTGLAFAFLATGCGAAAGTAFLELAAVDFELRCAVFFAAAFFAIRGIPDSGYELGVWAHFNPAR